MNRFVELTLAILVSLMALLPVHSASAQTQNEWYAPPYSWDSDEPGGSYTGYGYIPFSTITAAVNFVVSNIKEQCDSCKYSVTYYPTGVPFADYKEMFVEIDVTDYLGDPYGTDWLTEVGNPWFDPNKNSGCFGGCGAGDPINLGNGNEYEDQQDYFAGLLQFDRYYNSNNSVATTHIGAQWRDNFDRSIEYIRFSLDPCGTDLAAA
jgi:hypothetical protein